MKTFSHLCLCFLFSNVLLSQNDTPSPEDVQYFDIGHISVSGNQYCETKAIITRPGLRAGTLIQIPGRTIPRAIKALWKLLENFGKISLIFGFEPE